MTARKTTSARSTSAKTNAVEATVKREEAKRPEAQPQADMHAMFQAMGVDVDAIFGGKLPSKKTLVISLLVNIAVCAIGIVASAYLAGALLVGALTLSFPAFIALCIYCFAYMLGIVASVYAGAAAARYVATGQAAEHIEQAGSWIKSKFASTSTAIKSRMASLRGDNVTVH